MYHIHVTDNNAVPIKGNECFVLLMMKIFITFHFTVTPHF